MTVYLKVPLHQFQAKIDNGAEMNVKEEGTLSGKLFVGSLKFTK